MSNVTQYYIYHGDRLTDPQFKGAKCRALLRPDGKTCRGKNGNLLVQFELPYLDENLRYSVKLVTAVVVARLLRKRFPKYFPSYRNLLRPVNFHS